MINVLSSPISYLPLPSETKSLSSRKIQNQIHEITLMIVTTLVSKEDDTLKELTAKFYQLEMENKQAKGLSLTLPCTI